jgi:hypothetical protein
VVYKKWESENALPFLFFYRMQSIYRSTYIRRMVMASKIHPNESFLKKLSDEQIQMLLVETELSKNSKPYLVVLKDQLTRLEIKY